MSSKPAEDLPFKLLVTHSISLSVTGRKIWCLGSSLYSV
jgi:hypothetical protein